MTDDDPLLDLDEAARYAAASVDYLRRAARRPHNDPERLAAAKHAGRIKVRRSALNDWIDRTTQPI